MIILLPLGTLRLGVLPRVPREIKANGQPARDANAELKAAGDKFNRDMEEWKAPFKRNQDAADAATDAQIKERRLSDDPLKYAKIKQLEDARAWAKQFDIK